MNIYVTKSFLPPIEEYVSEVSKIFNSGILTNQGPEVQELEKNIKEYLQIQNFQYVTNGTVAIQIGLRALGITSGEIITTPFSYVATTSSILWEHCTPKFVDIEPDNFTIDPEKIEGAITPKTKAILPVHVFGYACDVEAIQKIATKHGLKVLYDAAHAFGSWYKGKALASFGDVSTLSFHATKLFHTIEGGACIAKDSEVDHKIDLIKKFGHIGDEHHCLGINGKQDEFNAAMGIVNLRHLEEIIASRKKASETYDTLLKGKVARPRMQEHLKYNYAYYPVLFTSESELLDKFNKLNKIGIFPRRYFYPSLNLLPYIPEKINCPISEDISSRIACLPLYAGLSEEDIYKICSVF
jgi:degT/dnrJ/eryC1/strS aminotransferase